MQTSTVARRVSDSLCLRIERAYADSVDLETPL